MFELAHGALLPASRAESAGPPRHVATRLDSYRSSSIRLRSSIRRARSYLTTTAEAIECCAPLTADALSDEEATATAELFKALADPARVRIVNLLATSGGEPVCICHLVEPLGLAQPTVSHHMKRLLDAGLVEREQRGKWAYFALKTDAVEKLALVADLKGVCC
jgi:ArsR family transcriptional regulator, arsenate/arsenite/antimonite-responsive transcriptional repressor